MKKRRLLAAVFACALPAGCDESRQATPPSPSAQALAGTTLAAPNESNYELAEAYAALRTRALQIKPEEIGLSGADESELIAVLMESGWDQFAVTLAAIADGTMSLYFSNGGGIIGGGEHAPVREAGMSLLAMGRQYLPKASPCEQYALPRRGHVRFYFVTPKEVRTVEAKEDDLGNNRHPLSPLFHQGHQVIAAIREHSSS